MKKNYISALLFVLLLTLSTSVSAQEITLDIYSVNDFHGALEQQGNNPGIAELAEFLKTKIHANKESTLLLSAGDMSTGTLASTLSKGKFVFDCMNELGFEAMTLGNHEFDWGLDVLSARTKQANFPLLAANIWYKDSKAHLDRIKPYVILEKSGLKIGIIGITTPQTAYTTSPKIIKDLVFASPSVVVQNLVDELKNKVDLIIVLSHLGSLQDEQNNISDEAADLANTVHGVDAIISGHTHKKVMGKVNNIPIVQADWSGRAVGHIQLTYDSASKKVVQSSVEFITLQPGNYPLDQKLAKDFEQYQNNILPLKNKVIAHLSNTLAHNKMELSPLGKCLTKNLRHHNNSDLAILTGGNIRSSLEEGVITYGMLFNTLPFDNSICTMEMTGEQIIQLLEQGLFRGTHGGALQFSGINITTNKNNIPGKRILQVTFSDGRKLDLNKTYKVATTDFLADGGDQLTVFTKVSNINRLSDKLVDIIAAEFAKQKIIDYQDNQHDSAVVDVNEPIIKQAA